MSNTNTQRRAEQAVDIMARFRMGVFGGELDAEGFRQLEALDGRTAAEQQREAEEMVGQMARRGEGVFAR